MVGFYAVANDSDPIRIDLDNELSDARWFTRAEVQAILAHPDGATITRREYKKLNENESTSAQKYPAAEENVEVEVLAPPPFRVPPTTAIAGVLIRDWAEGRFNVGTGQKGHL